MPTRMILTVLATFCLVLIGSSCTVQSSTNVDHRSVHQTTNSPHNQTEEQTQVDGHVISMKKKKINGLNPNLQGYHLMYWSQGLKVEAYVAVPKEESQYALMVICHGGYYLPPTPSQHHTKEIDGIPIGMNDIKNALPGFITVTPMYRGYGAGEGAVEGLNEDTIDTKNAIKAVANYTEHHKKVAKIEAHHLYLYGQSLGGGVALKLASLDKDVLAVEAISPYVGLDIKVPTMKSMIRIYTMLSSIITDN